MEPYNLIGKLVLLTTLEQKRISNCKLNKAGEKFGVKLTVVDITDTQIRVHIKKQNSYCENPKLRYN